MIAAVKKNAQISRRKGAENTLDDAQKLMISTDANRNAFVTRYFNADAKDPAHYDLILNTGTLSVDKAVQIIQCAMGE